MDISEIEIVGHRGASHDAPENTIVSFNRAWLLGADAIECDLHLTKDQRIVCIHDPTTERIACVNMQIAESSLKELRELDVGIWKGNKWRGERIPLLSEVLATVPANKRIFIEVKCGPEIVPQIAEIIHKSNVQQHQVAIISFDKTIVPEARKYISNAQAYWIVDSTFKENTLLSTLDQIGADGLDASSSLVLSSEIHKELYANNIGLHVWDVDDVDVAVRLIQYGARSLTTNRPGWLRDELAKISL